MVRSTKEKPLIQPEKAPRRRRYLNWSLHNKKLSRGRSKKGNRICKGPEVSKSVSHSKNCRMLITVKYTEQWESDKRGRRHAAYEIVGI